jgi:hypothetical protein
MNFPFRNQQILSPSIGEERWREEFFGFSHPSLDLNLLPRVNRVENVFLGKRDCISCMAAN